MVLGAEDAGDDYVLRAKSLCMGQAPSQKAPVSCLEETMAGKQPEELPVEDMDINLLAP